MAPAELAKATELMRFAIRLCEAQARAGKHFVLGQPVGATSWPLLEMPTLLCQPGGGATKLHMCQLNMQATDQYGIAPVYKPTEISSNCVSFLEACSPQCSGGHRHVRLLAGRARGAA